MKFTGEQEQIMEAAMQKYGTERQIWKTIEELGELSVELARFTNGEPDDAHRIAAIREELADVIVMTWQMEYAFGDVSSWIAYKLERLEKRMRAGL